ncbi:MAG: haloacid dehalogenase-like hydrolase [Bacilli bacterium]|jgi:hypothetical protein|nr:haloacid dehalogenase-like hydrolase [Bacilli bacterium]
MTKKTIIAFIYDFDHTLCTTDMQNYSFIPSLNIEPGEFWDKANKLTKTYHMDPLLAYMYLMLEESKARNLPISQEHFNKLGQAVQFFPGVMDWFKRINEYGKSKGVEIHHYVISSGNKEIIEGTAIYKYFKKVYACEYFYDENGNAIWPKSVVNYTTKTQYIYRINKGVLNVAENDKVNASMKDEDKPVPITNMVYIADGLTDVPCMKLVKSGGGTAIAVFDKNKKPAVKLFEDGRVDYLCEADYSEGSKIDYIAKLLIDKIAPMDTLYKLHYEQVEEELKEK